MRSNNPQSHLSLWHYTFYIERVAEQLPFLAALYCSELSIPTHHILFYHPVLFFPFHPLLISTLQTVHCVYFHVIFPYPYRRFANHHNQAFLFKTINYSYFLSTLRGVEQGQPTIGCKFCCQRMYKHIVVGTGLVWHEPTAFPFGEVRCQEMSKYSVGIGIMKHGNPKSDVWKQKAPLSVLCGTTPWCFACCCVNAHWWILMHPSDDLDTSPLPVVKHAFFDILTKFKQPCKVSQ